MNETVENDQECDLKELYSWIDNIFLSTHRLKKNVPRDFSDAVLMAEILKIYYPRHVDIHNYVPASSIQTKRDNWNTLNRKVLSRIDIKLNKDVINQLASSQQGVIEKVLIELRSKIEKNIMGQQQECMQGLINDGTDNAKNEEQECSEKITQSKSLDAVQAAVTASGTYFNMRYCIKNMIGVIIRWLISWIYVWTWLFKNHKKEITYTINSSTDLEKKLKNESLEQTTFDPESKQDCNYEKNETVPCHLYAQLKQELYEKSDTIYILNHKIVHLEEAMKLKDQHIASLLSHTSNSMESRIRPRTTSVSQLKLRTRPQPI